MMIKAEKIGVTAIFFALWLPLTAGWTQDTGQMAPKIRTPKIARARKSPKTMIVASERSPKTLAQSLGWTRTTSGRITSLDDLLMGKSNAKNDKQLLSNGVQDQDSAFPRLLPRKNPISAKRQGLTERTARTRLDTHVRKQFQFGSAFKCPASSPASH